MALLRLVLCLVVFSTALAVGPKSGKHTLTWKPSPSVGVTGYWLYWRSAIGSYNDSNRVGIATNVTSYNLEQLQLPPARWTLAMSATNAFDAESPLSVELNWDNTLPGPPFDHKIENP